MLIYKYISWRMFYINLFLFPGANPVLIHKKYINSIERVKKMLIITYIASLAYGFINFYQYNTGREILGKFMLKGLFTFALALIFCFFQWNRFENGEIAFTVKNIFPMWLLLAFHINLWINAEEDLLASLTEKSLCMLLVSFVSTWATRLIFALCF